MKEEKEALNIYQALAKITQEVEAIGKNKENKLQGYKFRGIDDIYNTLHNLYGKYGITIVPTVLNSEREERQTQKGGVLIYSLINYRFTFYALDGTNINAEVKGEGMDSSDKSSNKSFSAALKYCLMCMHLIPTKDLVDADNDNLEPAPKKTPSIRIEPEVISDLQSFKTEKDLSNYFNLLSKEAQEEHKAKFTARKVEILNSKINGKDNNGK